MPPARHYLLPNPAKPTRPAKPEAKPKQPADEASLSSQQMFTPLAAMNRQLLRTTRPARPDWAAEMNSSPSITNPDNGSQRSVLSATPTAIVPIHPTPLSGTQTQINLNTPAESTSNPARLGQSNELVMPSENGVSRRPERLGSATAQSPSQTPSETSPSMPSTEAAKQRPQRLGSASAEFGLEPPPEISDMEELFNSPDQFFRPPAKSNPYTSFESSQKPAGQHD